MPYSYLRWNVTESGYGYCPAATARAWIRTGPERACCSKQLAIYLLGVNELHGVDVGHLCSSQVRVGQIWSMGSGGGCCTFLLYDAQSLTLPGKPSSLR
jgi:hypothetical protein